MIERTTTTLSNKQKTVNISLTNRSIHVGAATLFSLFIVWLVAISNSKAKDDGIATGQAASSAIVALRTNASFGEFVSERTEGWTFAEPTQTIPLPATPNWSITGDLNVARRYHAATLLPDRKVLVIGGWGGGPSNSAELYDPATGKWTPTGSSNKDHYYPTATLLPNGKVLVVSDTSIGPHGGGAELYDPSTGTWSLTGSLNNTDYRTWHTTTLLPNGKVLVVGGADGDFLFIATKSAELYDPATGTWTSTGDLNEFRAAHTATLLPNGKVLVVGGVDTDEDGPIHSSAEIYDPITGIWTTTGSLSTGRCWHTATLQPNGKVLVAGGLTQGLNDYRTINSAELYDPSTGNWSTTGSLSIARDYQTATLLPDGNVLVAAGSGTNNASPTALNTAELYDQYTGTWSLTSSLNTVRYQHTATLLSNGKVLVAGDAVAGGAKSAELFDLGQPQSGTVASVSAASYSLMGLASEGIAAGFGAGLATTTIGAATVPLPTELAGTTVKVKDSAGAERSAPLFFVSPTQVNYQIPSGTAAGPATVTITSGDGSVSIGVALVSAVAPSLFTANGDGKGVASAIALRIKADGSRSYEEVAEFDQAQNGFVPLPIDLGPEDDQVFLVLFGTGIRFRSSVSSVIATIGGEYASVTFADSQGDFEGLDQVNVLLPRSLIGRGEADLLLTVDAQMANPVRVKVK
jgi:uncharacterized protein (TIGR03437 family)